MSGAGLELWTSHGIVLRHKGSLTLRSSDKPGLAGNVYNLFLPNEKNPAKPAE
jgi:signal transduction histidine kinase